MEFFFAVLVLIALCVIGLCFNIIFRKDGKFPETEIRTTERCVREASSALKKTK